MNHTYVKSIPVQNEGLSQSITISDGLVPKRIIICMVDTISSTSGKIDKNPFNFEHFGLTSFTLQEGSTNTVYSNALKFDFEKGLFLDGYWTLFEGIDKPSLGNNITRHDYANGYMFLAFDLTPNGECEPFNNIDRSDKITAELTWSKKSTVPLNFIIYLEYNKTLKLDKYRNIAK